MTTFQLDRQIPIYRSIFLNIYLSIVLSIHLSKMSSYFCNVSSVAGIRRFKGTIGFLFVFIFTLNNRLKKIVSIFVEFPRLPDFHFGHLIEQYYRNYTTENQDCPEANRGCLQLMLGVPWSFPYFAGIFLYFLYSAKKCTIIRNLTIRE